MTCEGSMGASRAAIDPPMTRSRSLPNDLHQLETCAGSSCRINGQASAYVTASATPDPGNPRHLEGDEAPLAVAGSGTPRQRAAAEQQLYRKGPTWS